MLQYSCSGGLESERSKLFIREALGIVHLRRVRICLFGGMTTLNDERTLCVHTGCVGVSDPTPSFACLHVANRSKGMTERHNFVTAVFSSKQFPLCQLQSPTTQKAGKEIQWLMRFVLYFSKFLCLVKRVTVIQNKISEVRSLSLKNIAHFGRWEYIIINSSLLPRMVLELKKAQFNQNSVQEL